MCLSALTRIEPADEKLRVAAVPAFIDALKRPDARTRALAAHALADLHSGDSAVLPAFIEALRDADPGVAHVALQALAAAGQPAVGPLMVALRVPATRRVAALALSHIGPPAEAAVSDLVRALDDPSPEVRHEVLIALAAIGPSAEDAAEDIKRVLQSDSDNDVVAGRPPLPPGASGGSQTGGRGARGAARVERSAAGRHQRPALTRMTVDNDALGQALVPVLIEGLKSAHQATRVEAAEGLGAWRKATKAQAALRDQR